MQSSEQAAWIDTSVIVRYLVRDNPVLAVAAAQILESDETLIVSEVALAEAAHVLGSVYRIPRPHVVDTLLGLVQRRNIRLARLPKTLLAEALRLCRASNRVSIVDALLWAQAQTAGQRRIYTLDRRFPGYPVEIVSPI
jgi:predicted nucleic acid-binding protein